MKGPLARILRSFLRYPWWCTLTLLSALGTTLLGLVFPQITRYAIDEVVAPGRLDRLPWMVLVLVLAFLLRDLLNALRVFWNNQLEQQVLLDLRQSLFSHLQRLSVTYYEKHPSGDVVSRLIDDINHVERVMLDGTEQGVVSVLTMVGVFWMLLNLHPTLALLSLLPIPLLLAGALAYTRGAHKRHRKIREMTGRLSAYLFDSVSGVREIRTFSAEGHEAERFHERADACKESTLSVMRLWGVYSSSMNFFASLGYVFLLAYGCRLLAEGGGTEFTFGDFSAFLLYVPMFYQPVQRLHGINQMMQQARAAAERLFDLLDAPVDVKDRPFARPITERPAGRIEFRNVHFSYSANVPILQGIDLTAMPGSVTAIVGTTGAGKSTLVSLIPRFYDPGEGAILLDGTDLRDFTLATSRAQIGIVAQEPFLFNGSIRENLLYGRRTANDQEIRDALEAAHAWDFVSQLETGWDAPVGERGVRLSVGEKQRLAIARALLKDPPVLILDEATSSVDTTTELHIQRALHRLMEGRTTFIIAHRLSTIRKADQILVLEKGRICERGSHNELIQQRGRYRQLHQAQMEPI